VISRLSGDRRAVHGAARLEPTSGRDITSEWQSCDLFGDGEKTVVQVDGSTECAEFLNGGPLRLQKGLRAIWIAPDTFRWPPKDDPDRSPYRGWQPLESVDAAVYFGRDAEINRALTSIRALRSSGDKQAFVILGPSGVGKSSFLRAGLLPRLQRDDRHFLTMEIMRPQRHPLTGGSGLAQSAYALRTSLGLDERLRAIKAGIGDPRSVLGWLAEAQNAAVDRFVNGCRPTAPTLILPVDQAEELFGADVGAEADDFLAVVGGLLSGATSALPFMVVSTIRADRGTPLGPPRSRSCAATRPGCQRGVQPRWNSDRVGLSGQDDPTVGRRTGHAIGAPLHGHDGAVLSVAFSPDTPLVAGIPIECHCARRV
jgi:AAA ATPase domain